MIEKVKVSIIIPCRNEEKFIAQCLDSILANDYPKDKLEVLVCDGMSEDGTREIVREYSMKHYFTKLLDNPEKITPCALNIGIKAAQGEIIIRMDAHATYARDYVSKCVGRLFEYEADNIGGRMITKTKDPSLVGDAIVHVLTSSFGVGNSRFRTGISKPIAVDTVFGGCYRKSIFDKIGMFNENLVRSQDMEFNTRLKRWGGTILLFPDIVATYYARSSLRAFFCHNWRNGVWVVYSFKFVQNMPVSIRHLVPLAFVLGLLGSLLVGIMFDPIFLWVSFSIISSHFLVNLFFSVRIAWKNGGWNYMLVPLLFFGRHFCYGLGSFWGLAKLVLSKRFWENRFRKLCV